jgi:putative ABC transport system permease protein
VDKDVPVFEVQTTEQALAQASADTRSLTVLMTAFALLALMLAAVGIYAVVAYSVTQRTHEIGVRLALGARPGDVFRLVVGQGMLPIFIGLGAGIVAALALSRLLASLLYGIRPSDPLTFAAVSVLLTVVALAASYIPARRATKVDPMVALRYE